MLHRLPKQLPLLLLRQMCYVVWIITVLQRDIVLLDLLEEQFGFFSHHRYHWGVERVRLLGLLRLRCFVWRHEMVVIFIILVVISTIVVMVVQVFDRVLHWMSSVWLWLLFVVINWMSLLVQSISTIFYRSTATLLERASERCSCFFSRGLCRFLVNDTLR